MGEIKMFDLDEYLFFLNKNKNNPNYILEILDLYDKTCCGDKVKEYYCFPEQQLYIIIDQSNYVHEFYKNNDDWVYWFLGKRNN